MKITIVGGGPAGLKAAEIAVQGGAKVILHEGKPSVGRKFLVAGHGGLNLTHSEPIEGFASRYEGSFKEAFGHHFSPTLGAKRPNYGPMILAYRHLQEQVAVFFQKSSRQPPLRSWVKRLKTLGVTIHTRHYLEKISPRDGRFILSFSTKDGLIESECDSLILALGGASWPETGSDAKWVSKLNHLGLTITPLAPANCGWEIDWLSFLEKDILRQIEGHPLKNLDVRAGNKRVSGELLITNYGFEGGALYQLGSTLRAMDNPFVYLDLKPTFNGSDLASKIHGLRGNLMDAASKAWRLSPSARALLCSAATQAGTKDPLALASLAKNLPIPLVGPRPIAEAISSAGGVSFDELDEFLMVKRHPGLFLAGEMIDWEAPTGGYLLQGCLATGMRAAQGALSYLKGR